MNKSIAGFTAVELVIVMALALLIVGFSFKGFVLFKRNLILWQERIALEQAGLRMIKSLTEDLYKLQEIQQAEPTVLTFVDNKGDSLTYIFRTQNIFKNGHPFVHNPILVQLLNFQYFSPEGDLQEYTTEKQKIERIKIHLILRYEKNKSFELISSVKLRNRRSF